MKRSKKFYIGIALGVQSFISFIMFIVQLKKNKTAAKAFFGLGLVGAIASAYLLYTEYQLSLNAKAEESGCCDNCSECDDECCCGCDDLSEESESSDDLFKSDESENIEVSVESDENEEASDDSGETASEKKGESDDQ